MEAQQSSDADRFEELSRLLGELREQVDGLRAPGLDAEQLQQRLTELGAVADRAAAALEEAAR